MHFLFKYITGGFLLLWMAAGVHAQPVTPADYNLRAYTLHNSSLGEIHYYVTTSGITTKKPLLLVLDGSGHLPMTILVQEKHRIEVMNTFGTDMLRLADRFHVVLISKPGVPFCDTVQINSDTPTTDELERRLPPPPEFNLRNGLEWRAGAASAVINDICRQLPVDRRRVVAYGFSEGAQVVPRLAVINKKVTHCAAIFGSGLNQLYDFIVAARMEAEKGHISPKAAQQRVDSLMTVFADIYQHPHDTGRQWEGHSYQRWASYGSGISLNHFTSLSIPIFVAAASQDRNSPIFGLDYIPLEFLRLGKKNLTYKVYPTDHFLNERVVVNGREEVVPHGPEMVQDLLLWLDTH